MVVECTESFKDLRAYEIVEKFHNKNEKEWNWIEDNLTKEQFENFKALQNVFVKYKELQDTKPFTHTINFDWDKFVQNFENIDIKKFFNAISKQNEITNELNIKDNNRNFVLKLDIQNILNAVDSFTNNDIVLNHIDAKRLYEVVQKKINDINNYDSVINRDFDDLTTNYKKYIQDISTYISLIKKDKQEIDFLTKKITKKNLYKEVSYLEQIELDNKFCDNRNTLSTLQNYLKELNKVKGCFSDLIKFEPKISDDANITTKKNELNFYLEHVKRNKNITEIIEELQYIKLFKFFGVENNNINQLKFKLKEYKERISEYQEACNTYNEIKDELNDIIFKLKSNSSLKNICEECCPIDKHEKFDLLRNRIQEVSEQILKERELKECIEKLEKSLPNTSIKLRDIQEHCFIQENFEFAQANYFLAENQDIDIQKYKDKISKVHSTTKCNF